MYSFSEYFFFSWFDFTFESSFFSPHRKPLIRVHLPRLLLLFFFPSLHPAQTWLRRPRGRAVRVSALTKGSWSPWCSGGFQHFGKVILSKTRGLHNFSKWTSKGLLRITNTSINCFRILLWPKRRSVGCRYIYYTLSAQNLLTSWWLCQGELILNPTGTLKGTLWPVVISPR